MINMGYLDRDWYEGIVQKLKWNVPIRPETDAADIAAFTSRSLLRSKGVQGHAPATGGQDGVNVVADGDKTAETDLAQGNGDKTMMNGSQVVQETDKIKIT